MVGTMVGMVAAWYGPLLASSRVPDAVDLRPQFQQWKLTPRAQGGRGTCSLFAIVGVLEYEMARGRKGPGVRLSPEYLNWASHCTNGRTVDGSFFSDALRGIEQFGVCREELMPYAAAFDPEASPSEAARADAEGRKGFTARWIKQWDPNTGLTDEQLRAIKEILASGHPVAAGLRWPKQAHFGDDHVLKMPPGEVFDGHSIVLVGYRETPDLAGGGAFLFRNSSGPDWCDAGHAWLPYNYVATYTNDALGIRVSRQRAPAAR